MRSRSHRVAEDTSMMGVDAVRQSCWANLPPELLRDVLMRIEESESTWPLRKNVVACAGVCRSWRDCLLFFASIMFLDFGFVFLLLGPRRMHCIMNAISISAIGPEGVAPILSVPLSRSKSSGTDSLRTAEKDEMLVLKNKTPTWHEQLQCWCLNFNGRVTVASVKNFQLVENGQEEENVILQFGKVGKDVFTMDYKYPISAFQAFAICLSSFDTKIACE
ncbi:hypothetical protein RD792_009356 [Penstemon davidsonii]|uniref:Tubby C-terminal domain-containing protein n=1 Tax=Penstemon davidsonii TaxID=160366 RepID=A0ABR0CYS8_9LAMI|nr:hypothetical protein RD792_009356 [Penstemon davidsonii]